MFQPRRSALSSPAPGACPTLNAVAARPASDGAATLPGATSEWAAGVNGSHQALVLSHG